MTKQQFIKKYNALSEQDKNAVKQYYNDLYNSALFIDTLTIAEKGLLWIMEAENV